jgi:hypothetical protein
VRPDELERRLRERLDALGPAPRAELLHVLMLPDFERADAIGSHWGNPATRTFAELVIDCEETASFGRYWSGYCGRPSASLKAQALPAERQPIMGQVVETGTRVCPYCSERVRAKAVSAASAGSGFRTGHNPKPRQISNRIRRTAEQLRGRSDSPGGAGGMLREADVKGKDRE